MDQRYKGNKWRLLPWIRACFEDYGLWGCVDSFADLFAGTGAVSWMMANEGGARRVWANDEMPCARVVLRARLCPNARDDDVSDRLDRYARTVATARRKRGFVTAHYAGSIGEKALFTHDVAADIDAWSRVVPRRDDHSWACLLHQVAKRANGMGKLDTPLTLTSASDRCSKPFTVVPISFVGSMCDEVVVTDRDVSDDHTFDRVYDLVYVDPPYTTSSIYQTEYHVLNTLALGDRPVVKGRYHKRADVKRSQFASRRHAKRAFERLIEAVRCRWIAISYSDAGILSLDEMQEIVRNAGYTRVKVYRQTVRRYSRPGAEVTEYLLLATKKPSPITCIPARCR